MKILYVEDELSKNIPKIINLFSSYLNENQIMQLQTFADDEYGASNEELKNVVELSNIIDVEYKFSSALEKVINDYQKYSLFIIDRNLSSEDYNTELITAFDSDYDNKLSIKYKEREGDYLLQKLVYKGIDILSKFYFLTAYSASELPNAEEIQNHIELKKFTDNNIIEKGNSELTRGLINKINNIEIFKLQWENKVFLDILRTNVGDKAPFNFIKLLQNKDSNDPVQISANFGLIRNLLENILTKIAKEKNAPEVCFNEKNKEQIVMGNVIYWITKEENQKQFASNSIIKNFLYDIKQVCSDFGSHNKSQSGSFLPTSNTVNALIFELKDIIIWFCYILK
ncbi:MAG: hypothetical protein HQ534_02570 [Armatimonadetes bacterium]|nr:hypothetical protein [Armatimonadota bacterium]